MALEVAAPHQAVAAPHQAVVAPHQAAPHQVVRHQVAVLQAVARHQVVAVQVVAVQAAVVVAVVVDLDLELGLVADLDLAAKYCNFNFTKFLNILIKCKVVSSCFFHIRTDLSSLLS